MAFSFPNYQSLRIYFLKDPFEVTATVQQMTMGESSSELDVQYQKKSFQILFKQGHQKEWKLLIDNGFKMTINPELYFVHSLRPNAHL